MVGFPKSGHICAFHTHFCNQIAVFLLIQDSLYKCLNSAKHASMASYYNRISIIEKLLKAIVMLNASNYNICI